jgi:lipid-binding SYLF domain-containing protein
MYRSHFGLALTSLLIAGLGHAQTMEEARLTNAGAVIQELGSDPETAIPPWLLQGAQGIAVIPRTIRAGLIFGGRRGRGVVTIRTESGEWANPSFITLTGGSFGAQIGIESADIVLVFGNARSVRDIDDGKFTLGGDASATAGPVGRASRAATDMTFTSEVYVYTDSRGLFAGASLEGTRLSIDTEANQSFYAQGGADQPLRARSSSTPTAAQRFLLTLVQAESSSPQTTPPPASQQVPAEEAITYPLGDGAD